MPGGRHAGVLSDARVRNGKRTLGQNDRGVIDVAIPHS